uniref:Uncharacterized protein n=1 Tax=Arundo donax TaxID=35708 RepID=A0A0A8XRU2_ARUDO
MVRNTSRKYLHNMSFSDKRSWVQLFSSSSCYKIVCWLNLLLILMQESV